MSGEPRWNLFAEIIGGRVRALIMPSAAGELPAAPSGDGWHAVAWPCNPHFTGESTIREILEERYPSRVSLGKGAPVQ